VRREEPEQRRVAGGRNSRSPFCLFSSLGMTCYGWRERVEKAERGLRKAVNPKEEWLLLAPEQGFFVEATVCRRGEKRQGRGGGEKNIRGPGEDSGRKKVLQFDAVDYRVWVL